MNPTQEKIQVNQTDYNNLADWAKPDYQAKNTNTALGGTLPSEMPINAPLTMPPKAITVDSLQPTGAVKIPKVQTTDTTSAGVIAGTQPSIDTALTNFNQAQQATGTVAQDERSKLNNLAASIFGEKAYAQANQVNLEKQAGLNEQMKVRAEINTEMANEQLRYRGEQDKIRATLGSTTAQKEEALSGLNDVYGRRLADLSIRQSAANQNITAIQENAERQTKLLTAPLDTKITYLSTFAKDNVDYLDKQQSEKLAFLVDDLKTQKQDIQALQKAKAEAIAQVAQNGGGTDQAVIKAIQDATDITGVAQGASKYIGLMDRQKMAFDQSMARASLGIQQANLAINRAELDMKLNAGKPIDVSTIVSNPNLPAGAKNSAVITALAANPKISDGTKTQIANVLAVSNAVQDLANARPTGDLKGVGTFVLAGRVPGFSNQEATDNVSYLKAIKLKTQVWASGASLSEDQFKDVMDLVPKSNDSDNVAKQKMNSLVNFMNTQVSSQFQSQGVNFKPEKVDLFLYDKASPEQKKQIEQELANQQQ